VQCLFALKTASGALQLAGMVMYLRTSPEEIEVLHVSVSEKWSGGRRGGLRSWRRSSGRPLRRGAPAARGVRRLSMVYFQGREFRVSLRAGAGVSSARVNRRSR
jgi:hypothetical protein